MDIIDIANDKRIVAFHVTNENNIETIEQELSKAKLLDIGNGIVFASANIHKPSNVEQNQWIPFPIDADNIPKQKNFILSWCKSKGFNGFLHMIESNVLFNAMTKPYIEKLESTMRLLDYDIHFSTATDRCNYVFNKFCPRLTINVDDDALKQQFDLPEKIYFTSHSNVSYTTWNFAALRDNIPKFDERFTIGMFYIIEFLARRRAIRKDNQLYYMNQYLSISDEVGAYDIAQLNANATDDKTMQDENEIFKSLNIDYAPDNNIDIVLDAMFNKLKEKTHDIKVENIAIS